MTHKKEFGKCETCGNSLVPVINRSVLIASQESLVSNGQAVYVPHARVDSLPKTACLSCHPSWLRVNELGKMYSELQAEKENAICDLKDLNLAGKILDRQREIYTALTNQIDELVKEIVTEKGRRN